MSNGLPRVMWVVDKQTNEVVDLHVVRTNLASDSWCEQSVWDYTDKPDAYTAYCYGEHIGYRMWSWNPDEKEYGWVTSEESMPLEVRAALLLGI